MLSFSRFVSAASAEMALFRSRSITLGLSLWASLSFIVLIGPELQNAVVGVARSSRPNIYDAVYKNGIAHVPTLANWLGQAVSPIPLFVAFATSYAAIRQKELRYALINAAISNAIAFTIVDTITISLRGWSFAGWMTNLVANIFGGFLVAAVVAILFSAARQTAKALSPQSRMAKGAVFTVVTTIGIILSCAGWYATRTMFSPLPVRMQYVAEFPVSGFYFPVIDTSNSEDAMDYGERGERERPFRLIPRDDISGEFASVTIDDDVRMRWKRLDLAPPYNLEVRAFASCLGRRVEPAIDSQPSSVFSGVGRVHFRTFGDITYARMSKLESSDFTISAPMAFFWIETEGKGKVKVDAFAKESPLLTARTSKTFSMSFDMPLLDLAAGGSAEMKAVEKKSSIIVDGRPHISTFVGSTTKKSRACLPLVSWKLDRRSRQPFVVPGESVRIVLTFVPKPSAKAVYVKPTAQMKMKGTGSASVSQIPVQELAEKRLGVASGFSVSARQATLIADGVPVDVAGASVQATGWLSGSFPSESRLRLAGRVDSLWVDAARINKTGWEVIGVEWKILLLTALFGLVALVCRTVWPITKEASCENPSGWLL